MSLVMSINKLIIRIKKYLLFHQYNYEEEA